VGKKRTDEKKLRKGDSLRQNKIDYSQPFKIFFVNSLRIEFVEILVGLVFNFLLCPLVGFN